jgi:hypothetical protein
MLKEELESSSKTPRDQTINRHSGSLKKGQLTLSQGRMKMRDDVADDDDVVRTNVTAPLCTEELFFRTRGI